MKKHLGSTNALYPLPTVLIGTIIDNNVNFITIAHVGIIALKTISISMNKNHYTNQGIKHHNTFSVNIPNAEQVKPTDYCGLVSGKNTDKSHVFTVFYGTLNTAPMIQECPITMECRLAKTIEHAGYDIFIGDIENTYCDDTILTNGKIDIGKLNPLLFSMHDTQYWTLGKPLAKAWNIGKTH